MLVLALIGMISALGLAWLGGDPGRLHEARLEQLAVRFARAGELARQRGWTVGWRFEGDGYRFMRLTPGATDSDWSTLEREGPGDSDDWPPDLRLLTGDVREGGVPVQQTVAPRPLRLWFPGGERLGHTLYWAWPGGQARLDADDRLLLEADR